MLNKRHQQPQHICRFTKTNKTLETLYPSNLPFSKIRKKFRELFLVSEENGKRSCTPKGSVGYLFEKEQHLRQHFYMIHPFSKFREVWELAVTIEIIVGLTIRTFLVSQFRTRALESLHYQLLALLCDLFETTDTALCFLTGYIDVQTRNVELEKHKIFCFCVKKLRFPFNVISSLPLDFIIYISSINLKSHPIFKLCVFLKILKLSEISRYTIHMSKIYNWSEFCLRAIWTAEAMFIIIHWLSCLVYLILYGDEFGKPNNEFAESDTCFYRHFAVFYLVSSVFFFQNAISDNLIVSETKDMLLIALLLMLSHLLNVVFLGLLIQIMGLTNSSYIQYEEMIQEMQKFLIQENLPKNVHKKVIKYFQFRFRYSYFREKMILETLSPPLRQEIANFLCIKLLIHPESIFKDIPQELASSLCLKLKFEVFLAGDVITRAGKEAKKMYFISCGSVVAYSPRGKEIMHLYEGQQFGLASFTLIEAQYLITAIALEISECYSLLLRDFINSTSDYPDYRNFISKAATKKLSAYKNAAKL